MVSSIKTAVSNSPFSDEIPGLLQSHLDHLQTSGIFHEAIRQRGYESVLGHKRLKDLGFGRQQCRTTGMLIPLWGVNGHEIVGYQFRPDSPRLNSKGKPIKYENPRGISVRLDTPPACRESIGNPGVPIWFVEGVKKADSLASRQECAVTLTGVWNFKGRNSLGGTTILADFDYIALKDRECYMARNRQIPVPFAAHITGGGATAADGSADDVTRNPRERNYSGFLIPGVGDPQGGI